ncbi:hypothetical protein Nepgr_001571 [Nepenthes gracilis]|uniref:PWWP domain-containing protein n=1 Tax=Nepenthes gracilis TaxID=150966 RepID=A0AAD3RW59_NEPGR|nr:hypothetical protein Nepgr_001571 [Nepenthes gracilis]
MLESDVDLIRVLPKPEGDFDARAFGGDADCGVDREIEASRKIRAFPEVVASEGMGYRVREVAGQAMESRVPDDDNDDAYNVGADGSRLRMDGADGDCRLQKRGDAEHDVMITLYDGDAAKNVAGQLRVGSMKVGFGFEMGDMVWGKVKSHPWWPGHIFNEAFASPSVRRMKSDGHVLVAFFGDSSYGWFEPAELIPYDPYFSENSLQANSRNFLNALEDSVEEASRRSALGLSCRCRNPSNFRPTRVQGYFAVDVFDYESGGIYSVSQIRRARENFQTAATLSFMKQLALAPIDVESRSIDFIKKKSISLSYRRAIFEEFDETYAQAFGQEPIRPGRSSPSVTDRPTKDPTRAPLSGPQVFAEALGGQKISTKSVKSKEHAKRDRYLFKRRDERRDSMTPQSGHLHATSSLSSSIDQVVSVSEQNSTFMTGRAAADACKEPAWGPSVSTGGKEGDGLCHVTDNRTGDHIALDVGLAGGSGKKINAAKIAPGELGSVKPEIGRKKKRKIEAEMSSGHLHKKPVNGNNEASAGKLLGKPIKIAASLSEDPQLSHQKSGIEGGCISSMSEQVAPLPFGGAEKSKFELPWLLGDLEILALNPLHGARKDRHAILKQVFLRFRSLVFQKSSVVLSPAATGPYEVRLKKSPPVSGPPINAAGGETRGVRTSKPPKPLGRPDGPTIAGRKSLPSDYHDEIAAKRVQKLLGSKSSGGEKRMVQKISGMQPAEERGKVAAVAAQPPPPPPPKTSKAGSCKSMQPPPRVEEPTYLVMKYPSGTSLPSSNELKARFARFGPMDPSGNRIFYKTSTCRVIFLYKQDAQRAHRYAEGNKSVFPNVRFFLKPLSASKTPNVGEDTANEPPPAQPPTTELQPATPVLQLPPTQPPAVQLKSCLKRPTGDEVSGPGVRGGRVRFNMGEESSGRKSNLSSSVAFNIDNNNQKLIASHSLPTFPLPLGNQQDDAVGPIVNHNYNPTNIIPNQAPSVDISQQMLSLLMRCNDVVANVKSKLGHVPYHPL